MSCTHTYRQTDRHAYIHTYIPGFPSRRFSCKHETKAAENSPFLRAHDLCSCSLSRVSSYVWMYVCICVCMDVRVYVCMYVQLFSFCGLIIRALARCHHMYVWMYVCVCVYVWMCVCTYVCMKNYCLSADS